MAESAGARTQLTGVIGAGGVALLLVLAPNLIEQPAQRRVGGSGDRRRHWSFEVRDLKRIYRIQRWEFWLSMLCFVGVAVFGAIQGIGIAIIVAVIEFLWDGWRRSFPCWGPRLSPAVPRRSATAGWCRQRTRAQWRFPR